MRNRIYPRDTKKNAPPLYREHQRKSAQRRSESGQSDERALFHEIEKSEVHLLVFDYGQPHHCGHRGDGREQRAHVGADHRGEYRRHEIGLGHRGKYAHEEHAHGQIVHEIGRSRRQCAEREKGVAVVEHGSYLFRDAVVHEREHDHEHGDEERHQMPRHALRGLFERVQGLLFGEQAYHRSDHYRAGGAQAYYPPVQPYVGGDDQQDGTPAQPRHADREGGDVSYRDLEFACPERLFQLPAEDEEKQRE